MTDLFKRLRCTLGQHSPSRRQVIYEGHLKVGPCKHCGKTLAKAADGRWLPRGD